jgi:integrase
MPRIKGEKTPYAGVERLGENLYRVRARVTDPRTGKRREADQQFEGTAKEADRFRADLERALLEQPVAKAAPTSSGLPRRPTVTDFARFWLTGKKLALDPATLQRYVAALDLHALPAFGDLYCDAVLMADVQAWVNAELAAVDELGEQLYGRATVHSWFRIVRTMMRDAVAQLRLAHDPTMRISFPDLVPKHEGENRLTAAELQPFLDEVRIQAPTLHAITCTLAWTGLRFCHASALRWEDIDELRKTITVRRKNVRGRIGPVSKKKKAPDVLPLMPELANVLRWHQEQLVAAAGEYDRGARALDSGWVFPARSRRKGGDQPFTPIHSTGSLRKGWEKALAALQKAGSLDDERFTVHGLRRTFNDLLNAGKVDEQTKGALTAQSPEMRAHYSTVDMDAKRAAMESVMQVAKGGTPEGGLLGGQKRKSPREGG